MKNGRTDKADRSKTEEEERGRHFKFPRSLTLISNSTDPHSIVGLSYSILFAQTHSGGVHQGIPSSGTGLQLPCQQEDLKKGAGIIVSTLPIKGALVAIAPEYHSAIGECTRSYSTRRMSKRDSWRVLPLLQNRDM